MNQDYQNYQTQNYQGGQETTANAQKVMSRTFLFMFLVLALSAASAYITANSDLGFELLMNSGYTVLIVAELVVFFIASYVMRKEMTVLSAIMLVAYSIINGMTLSVIFYIYDMTSIVNIFLMAAALFGGMAVFGMITKKDLTTMGQMGIMALWGVIIFGVANLFIKSESLDLGLSVIGLALFIGITAYDTQRIKENASYYGADQVNTAAMFGALCLYLDFINIFLKLLRLFGNKRN
ncbi:membrane protein [Lachnospiraceae bacterium KM106-2]|nr:membrane protein [Lachnospiraceae bacterium KM106-2]